MITLNTTTRKLQVVLSGTVTTNQLPVVTSYADKTTSSYTGGANRTTTNNTTQVDIVAAPAASTIREVDFISVYNKDTASRTVTILFDDNGTDAELIKATLAVDDTLIYSHAQGWKVLDANGATKTVTTVPTTSAQLAAQITDETGTGALVFGTSPTLTGPVVLNANSSSDALRITQTGSGNALVVEDSSNPDSTPVVIDSDGRVLIGNPTPLSVSGVAGAEGLQLSSTGSASAMSFSRWSNDNSPPAFTYFKSRSGTVGTFGVNPMQNGDLLGAITFRADNGTTFLNGGQLILSIDGTPSATAMPGAFTINLTAKNSSTLFKRLNISSDGLLSVGESGAASGIALSTTTPSKFLSGTGQYTDAVTGASGTVTHGAIVSLLQTGIAASNTNVTYTNATTLYIDNSPAPGTNVTISNPWSLYVNSGSSRFNEVVSVAKISSSSQTSGVGYSTGAGGTVTQATSKATGVTLNRVCGQITTAADALLGLTRTSFTFTNSAIAATDNINVHRVSGGTANAYRFEVDSVAAGSCVIAITNITAGSLSEAVVISFSVMKCVTS